ncbi:hypothetical protein ACYX7E_14020 [Luteimonas sp. RIT-PG2_3]
MTTRPLPESFPPGTLFANVGGVPVTESPDGDVEAWDTTSPRRFPATHLAREGMTISEGTFRAMVACERRRYRTGVHP